MRAGQRTDMRGMRTMSLGASRRMFSRRSALGERFDIRDFHDAVLTEGGLPLDILRARIDAYIARETAAP